MASHLYRGKLNIGLVQEQSRRELLDLLDKCDGTKTIIWDDGLSGPFGLISEYNLLRKRDVNKMHPLCPGKLHSVDTDNIIFITRPYLKLMNYIAENVHGEESMSRKKVKRWHIFFVPMKSLLCTEYLKNKGVYGSFTTIEEMPSCLVFPIDNDVLSMEMDNSFKEYYIENDPACLYQVAKTILMLQDIFGTINRVYGKGDSVAQVWKLMNRLSKEPAPDSFNASKRRTVNSQIDQLILLDRGIDLLSPVVTQLTYEGLIDELYRINSCTVKLPAEKFTNTEDDLNNSNPEKKSVILNSSDEIFAEIRDKAFSSVGQILSRKAKHISSQFDERHNDKTLQEMKQFVAKLPQMLAIKKCLATHMTVAELVKEQTDKEEFLERLRAEQDILLGIDTDKVLPYIEDCMAHKHDFIKILRLICMQSAVNSGLKPKVLEQYKRDIIQTYGFQHLLTLINLEKAGLIKVQQSTRTFTILRKMLKLTVEETNDNPPRDINYVHSIYAPLTVRIAQHTAKPGSWKNLSNLLSLLPGALLDQTVTGSSASPVFQRRGSSSSQSDLTKVILVFFIGGCTFAEISALRFLSQQEDLNVEFVIATTKIINGNSFLESLMEPL